MASNGLGSGTAVPLAAKISGFVLGGVFLIVGLYATSRVPDGKIPLRLAGTLHHAQVERSIKILMVTSALASEGKTLTSTNLALTFSESYRRSVLLIDADLRRPSLHDTFRVPNVSGLGDGLRASADEKLSLVEISPRLTLLTAGRRDVGFDAGLPVPLWHAPRGARRPEPADAAWQVSAQEPLEHSSPGSQAVVQSPQSAVVAEMPSSVIGRMAVDHVVAPAELADLLVRLVAMPVALANAPPPASPALDRGEALTPQDAAELVAGGGKSAGTS